MTTGSQVVSDNAQASATPGFFTSVLGALAGGVRGLIDLELAERAASIPDRAEVREIAPELDPSNPKINPLGAVFENLTAVQIGGLLVAAGLAFGLATGAFK